MKKQAIKKEISLRLTEEELKNINRNVSKTNFSREQFIRNILNKKVIKEKPPLEAFDFLRNLQKIIANCRQIYSNAKKENSKEIKIIKEQYEKSLEIYMYFYTLIL